MRFSLCARHWLVLSYIAGDIVSTRIWRELNHYILRSLERYALLAAGLYRLRPARLITNHNMYILCGGAFRPPSGTTTRPLSRLCRCGTAHALDSPYLPFLADRSALLPAPVRRTYSLVCFALYSAWLRTVHFRRPPSVVISPVNISRNTPAPARVRGSDARHLPAGGWPDTTTLFYRQLMVPGMAVYTVRGACRTRVGHCCWRTCAANDASLRQLPRSGPRYDIMAHG